VPGSIIKQLGITDVREQAQFLAVVTIPLNNPNGITVNLLAPILVNRLTNVAKQVIVQNETYSIRTPVATAPEAPTMTISRPTRALAAAGA
jgi:flagellar assembly factor FliW